MTTTSNKTISPEAWLAVVGYEGLYEVSSQGRVASFWSGSRKLLRPSIRNRYWSVLLYRDGKKHRHSVHCLMLEAFVGPRPEGQDGLHGDDDPNRNQLDNLAWGTRQQNISMRDHARGVRQGNAKLTEAQVLKIRALRQTHTLTQLAKQFGVSFSTIGYVSRGEAWKHL